MIYIIYAKIYSIHICQVIFYVTQSNLLLNILFFWTFEPSRQLAFKPCILFINGFIIISHYMYNGLSGLYHCLLTSSMEEMCFPFPAQVASLFPSVRTLPSKWFWKRTGPSWKMRSTSCACPQTQSSCSLARSRCGALSAEVTLPL